MSMKFIAALLLLLNTAAYGQTANENPAYILDTVTGPGFTGDTAQQMKRVLQFVSGFDKASTRFKKDSFLVETGEGCLINVMTDPKTGAIKFYGTQYGEMGKILFRFYTQKGPQLQLACVIFTRIAYDRPMYLKDMQVKSIKTTYQVYGNNTLIAILDKNKRRQPVPAARLKEEERESQEFFKEYIGQMKREE